MHRSLNFISSILNIHIRVQSWCESPWENVSNRTRALLVLATLDNAAPGNPLQTSYEKCFYNNNDKDFKVSFL